MKNINTINFLKLASKALSLQAEILEMELENDISNLPTKSENGVVEFAFKGDENLWDSYSNLVTERAEILREMESVKYGEDEIGDLADLTTSIFNA